MPRRRRRKRRQRDDDDERIPLLSLSKKRKGNEHARSLLSSFSPFLRRKRIKKVSLSLSVKLCLASSSGRRFVRRGEGTFLFVCTCVTKYPPLSSLFFSLFLFFFGGVCDQARLSFFDQKTIHSSRGIKIKLFQIHSPAVASIGVTHAHDNNNRKTDASVPSRWFRAIFFFALNTHALRFIRAHKTHRRKRDPLL